MGQKSGSGKFHHIGNEKRHSIEVSFAGPCVPDFCRQADYADIIAPTISSFAAVGNGAMMNNKAFMPRSLWPFACADDTELVLLHEDAFAADYQEDEYMLLGMAIKYAGLRGKEVPVIGKNRSTLGEEDRIQ